MNILFEVTPYNGATPVTLRITNVDADVAATTADSKAWTPCISQLPTLTAKLSDDGILGTLDVSRGEIKFYCNDTYGNHSWSSLKWTGAHARIWVGAPGSAFGSYVKYFEGKVSGLERQDNEATVRLLGPEAELTGNILSLEYMGTGGIEGPASLKGKSKPRCYGSPKCLTRN